MSDTKIQIQKNLNSIHNVIEKQAREAKRSHLDINLIAVSKRQPIEKLQAALDCGHRLFGENKVQEAQDHWQNLRPRYPDLKLHLIGPLQTNKVTEAVQLFDVIETVDRPKLVKALVKEIEKQNKPVSCYIQVNTGEEPQKSGVLPNDLPALMDCCIEEDLKISGLMCIPPLSDPPALHFAFLAKLANYYKLPNLSMGMSNDFEKAIPLGTTHLRIGTAIFGERNH